MSAGVEAPLMTTEELLALPEDGVRRELIRGRLKEEPMTVRNHRHSGIEARVTQLLFNWLDGQPEPRGKIVCGEAGFRLRHDPDSTVGVDVAYASAEQLARTPETAVYLEGPPILAVEILSPPDKYEDITEKVQEYLDAGVALVWVVDPVFRTVMIYRPGAEPEFVNVRQELTAEPHLPGFRAAVAALFA
jgi:Uma2 family endonuclease